MEIENGIYNAEIENFKLSLTPDEGSDMSLALNFKGETHYFNIPQLELGTSRAESIGIRLLGLMWVLQAYRGFDEIKGKLIRIKWVNNDSENQSKIEAIGHPLLELWLHRNDGDEAKRIEEVLQFPYRSKRCTRVNRALACLERLEADKKSMESLLKPLDLGSEELNENMKQFQNKEYPQFDYIKGVLESLKEVG